MPGGGPRTETITTTQGHLPHHTESPPAAPIADLAQPGADLLVWAVKCRSTGSAGLAIVGFAQCGVNAGRHVT
jgi:hypothetical protein